MSYGPPKQPAPSLPSTQSFRPPQACVHPSAAGRRTGSVSPVRPPRPKENSSTVKNGKPKIIVPNPLPFQGKRVIPNTLPPGSRSVRKPRAWVHPSFPDGDARVSFLPGPCQNRQTSPVPPTLPKNKTQPPAPAPTPLPASSKRPASDCGPLRGPCPAATGGPGAYSAVRAITRVEARQSAGLPETT